MSGEKTPHDRTSIHMAGSLAQAYEAQERMSERPSLTELFNANLRFVWRVLASHGVLRDDIKDVAQEVFLTAHRRMDDWDPERASARTWLYSIAIRLASNYRRGARRAQVRGKPEVDTTPPPDPHQELDRNRNAAKLRAAIEALEPDKREVFVLFELEGVSMKEVAAMLQCPLQTAYTRLYGARREIASAMGASDER
jgi:RNA polymerase sigma-70 factor, ECF subfamily